MDRPHRVGEPVGAMRALTAAATAAGVVVLSLAVAMAGRIVAPSPNLSAEFTSGEVFGPPIPAGFEPPHAVPEHYDPARPVATAMVAPPELGDGTLEREAPRDPLGPLGQALPPPPVKPDDWDGTILYRPVAVGSAEFEAMGYRIAIAGTQSIDPAQLCEFDGAEWPCGVRARAAVRLWLRGRALSCIIPPEADRQLLVADCRLGKQDVGTWLVSNGWARAAAGGPYTPAEEQARKAKAGIYGPPPTATN
jgi:endonuclease YncB( thermonuclease family)